MTHGYILKTARERGQESCTVAARKGPPGSPLSQEPLQDPRPVARGDEGDSRRLPLPQKLIFPRSSGLARPPGGPDSPARPTTCGSNLPPPLPH